MAANEPLTGSIIGAAISDLVTGSSDVVLTSNERTQFSAQVADPGVVAERELAPGTIDISSSAIGNAIIGSKDVRVNDAGSKTSIKLSGVNEGDAVGGTLSPESDMGAPRVSVKGGFVNNAILDCEDTEVSMKGVQINIKRRNPTVARQPMPGAVNMSSSAIGNMVAFSEKTSIDMQNAKINIEN